MRDKWWLHTTVDAFTFWNAKWSRNLLNGAIKRYEIQYWITLLLEWVSIRPIIHILFYADLLRVHAQVYFVCALFDRYTLSAKYSRINITRMKRQLGLQMSIQASEVERHNSDIQEDLRLPDLSLLRYASFCWFLEGVSTLQGIQKYPSRTTCQTVGNQRVNSS